MVGIRQSNRAKFMLLMALLALVLAANAVLAASTCKSIKGRIVLQSVTGPTCTSPTGLCATGTMSGGLKGTLTFTASDVIATVDTPSTGVIFVLGDSELESDSSQLFIDNAFALKNTGNGEFGGVDVISGGTGEWAGATGQISTSGTSANGVTDGSYTGEICTP